MNRPTITIEQEKPDTLRVGSLQQGEGFLYEENLYLKIQIPDNGPSGPFGYCSSVRLQTGQLSQLREDVQVIPVALAIRAVRLKVVSPATPFPGIDGPS